MAPSTADFSEILELQQFRRLYEEQEEKTKLKITEKEEVITDLQHRLSDRDEELRRQQASIKQAVDEQERLRGEYNRLRQEAQEKIDKLMTRIKELNQQIMGEAPRR